ncbi:MAG: RNA polymerase factor sigma-54 [Mariprofundaceae bacterium]|nr:RNA polymerase factor sigma-54 [Mariprofundaceae bacterium]
MAGVQVRQNLSQKTTQRLALTPQLTQSLKVLAMNSQALELYVEQSLESNPLLETDPSLSSLQDDDAPAVPKKEEDWREQGDNRWETMYHNGSQFDGMPDQDQQWEDEQSLSDSLHEQINRQPMSDTERYVGHIIVDSLEDDGYFRASTQEIIDAAGIKGLKSNDVIQVLEVIVQELEPAGIGARDLTECLLIQISDDDASAMMVRQMLLHHADLLVDNDQALLEALGCRPEKLIAAQHLLRRLDPFPGHGLRGQANIYVRPEIIFRLVDQQIEVEVPQSGWRGLKMSAQWQGQKWSGKDREFMDAAGQEAKWLLHALGQRSDTLMKVGLCLAQKQRLFLEHGILGLKPLTLQDVAEEVGLHESTISRVTNSKYAQTPLGMIELRRFFSAGLPTRGGGAISVYRVQQRVRTLIDSEPSGRPISDQAISDRLQAEGVEIARRTVAKYREHLGLPPSSQRRRAAKARLSQSRR